MRDVVYMVIGVTLMVGGFFIYRRDDSDVGSRIVAPAMVLVGAITVVLGLVGALSGST